MRKRIMITIVLLTTIWITSANDCKSVLKNENWIIISQNWNFNNILPKEAFEKALENLQKFCCSQDSLRKDLNYCTDIVAEQSVPSSAYLFDHIFDVSIRRLDAKEENENGNNLVYGLKPDALWKEWRDFITKRWNNYKWNVPLEIINEFKKHWILKKNILVTWNAKNNIPWGENNFEGYSDWTLWERYNWICETSVFMYLNKIPNADQKKLYNAYLSCESMIEKRIKNEFDYTNTILMQKWNKLLQLNIKAYLDNYFSQNKMVELQQIVFDIKTMFNEINKAIPKLVENCS